MTHVIGTCQLYGPACLLQELMHCWVKYLPGCFPTTRLRADARTRRCALLLTETFAANEQQ